MGSMTFEGWIAKMRAARKVPFGTAYESFAREAWMAAKKVERESCAKVCEELDTYEPEIRQECADAIRKRSNV